MPNASRYVSSILFVYFSLTRKKVKASSLQEQGRCECECECKCVCARVSGTGASAIAAVVLHGRQIIMPIVFICILRIRTVLTNSAIFDDIK